MLGVVNPNWTSVLATSGVVVSAALGLARYIQAQIKRGEEIRKKAARKARIKQQHEMQLLIDAALTPVKIEQHEHKLQDEQQFEDMKRLMRILVASTAGSETSVVLPPD